MGQKVSNEFADEKGGRVMRSIRIKKFHKIPILMQLLLLLVIPLLLWLIIIGILNHSGLAFVGGIPLAITFVGLGCYFG